MFSLDNRLMTCASFVPSGARLADIGTDHAYLPVWLLKHNRITYAIASDVNSGPLESGKATAEKYQADNIDFRLGSGVETLTKEDNINCIVIAGMGGELIADILSKNQIIKDKNLLLILQPMTKAHELVKYLYKEGFEISGQKTCESHKKHYTVMAVNYTGNCQEIDEVFAYTGKLDFSDASDRNYISHQISNLENQAKGNPHFGEIANYIKDKLK